MVLTSINLSTVNKQRWIRPNVFSFHNRKFRVLKAASEMFKSLQRRKVRLVERKYLTLKFVEVWEVTNQALKLHCLLWWSIGWGLRSWYSQYSKQKHLTVSLQRYLLIGIQNRVSIDNSTDWSLVFLVELNHEFNVFEGKCIALLVLACVDKILKLLLIYVWYEVWGWIPCKDYVWKISFHLGNRKILFEACNK